EPDFSAPDESKTSCTRMVAVAEALIVVGGVSFWGNMYPRNGTVRTVSALRPAARRIDVKTATARVLCTCHLHFNAYSERTRPLILTHHSVRRPDIAYARRCFSETPPVRLPLTL